MELSNELNSETLWIFSKIRD